MLRNYGIPFFADNMRRSDPNKWADFGEEFRTWLQDEALTLKKKRLSVATCNRVVSSMNKFLLWMKRKKIITHRNYRPFETVDQRGLRKRGVHDLVSDADYELVRNHMLTNDGQLYADLWFTQRRMGFRVMELLGIPFCWLSDDCPDFIKQAFESKGCKVYGSIYLESQPKFDHIKLVNGLIERVPLKGRPSIGVDFSRTVPVLCPNLWDMLVERYERQRGLFESASLGPLAVKESYLLFEGAQKRKYLQFIREAYKKEGREASGSHVLRHTVSTDWTALKIDSRTLELVLGHKEKSHAIYVHIVGQVNAERQKAAPLKRLLKSVEKTGES